MTKLFAALRGFVYGAGFTLLWGWVMMAARRWDDRVPFTIPAWAVVPGVVIAACGAVLTLWCVVAFALVGRGTPAPFDAPREFVAAGPYRYVRNPMYIGGMIVIAGVGLILRSPSAVAVVVLFAGVFHTFVVLYEERALESRFGQSYLRYKSSVRRWLPRAPRGEAS